MVSLWSFDRYWVPRVLRSENPKLKPAAKTENSYYRLPEGASFYKQNLGKSVVSYRQVFCLEKQENLSILQLHACHFVIPARFWPESRTGPDWIPAKGMPE